MSEGPKQAPARVPVTRARHYACIHPETYKYFFDRRGVLEIWRRLGARYGPVQARRGFGVMEIIGERFILRATIAANPITVIRTRHCTDDDVEGLHALFGYDE